jgi:prepilin-type N-terminal cleavage/methylation domain-containing protein
MHINKKAFTLIELLVVVLIIGILAAVALPQYQRAVDKAKMTKAVSLIRPFKEAMERYYLANSKYPPSSGSIEDFNNLLDIKLPVIDGLQYWTYAGIYVSTRVIYKNRSISIVAFLDNFFLDQPDIAKAYGYDKFRGQILCTLERNHTPAEEAICKAVCGNDTFKLVFTSGEFGCVLGKSDW